MIANGNQKIDWNWYTIQPNLYILSKDKLNNNTTNDNNNNNNNNTEQHQPIWENCKGEKRGEIVLKVNKNCLKLAKLIFTQNTFFE